MWADILYVILMVLCLLLLGVVIGATLAEKQPLGERANIYSSNFFVMMLNLLWIPMLVIFIVLLFMRWKITLIITIPFWLFGGPILKRISEFVIIFPLYLYLEKKLKSRSENNNFYD